MEQSAGPEVPSSAESVVIHPVTRCDGTVRLPGSKSLTNRALLLAGWASGHSELRNVLDCDDSRYMIAALEQLGVQVTRGGEPGSLSIAGAGGPFGVKSGEFYLGNAGTTTRFLTAGLTTAGGSYRVDGDERMRQRPIADLVRALNQLGARVSAPSGCPPVDIGPKALEGGEVDMWGGVSSQFISAVLMAAPLARRRVALRITGELVSRPYLDLTLAVMRSFGARAYVDDRRADGQPFFEIVPGTGYRAREYFVEGDASAASYFYAAAAVTGSTVRVEGVGKDTSQGDLRCADVLAEMGCRVQKERDVVTVTGGLLRGIDCDCADMPDVVPTLAVVSMFARGRTRLRGVAHLRHKESDRIASVASELRKLGASARELRDGIEVQGSAGRSDNPLRGGAVDTWEDHRLAMAFSVAGLVLPGMVVRRPGVVGKSFPGFFGALAGLRVPVEFRLPGGETVRWGERCGS